MIAVRLEKDVNRLLVIFNRIFSEPYNTELLSDRDEPVYYPATNTQRRNRIIFANGYFNSALHEISHWVVAGKERRKLEDYGYWYDADGRTAKQQQKFEAVEVLPQAIEKSFCEATARVFKPSLDNLQLPVSRTQIQSFTKRIEEKQKQLQQQGFPQRAEQFLKALTEEFKKS